MTDILSLTIAIIFLSLCLLHVYWAVGGRWGNAPVIPTHNGQPLFQPSPAITLVVAAALLTSSLLAVGNLSLWDWGGFTWLFKLGIGGVSAVLLLRAIGDFRFVGFFKRVRTTPFARWDTRLYSPLCLALAIGCAIIGLTASGK